MGVGFYHSSARELEAGVAIQGQTLPPVIKAKLDSPWEGKPQFGHLKWALRNEQEPTSEVYKTLPRLLRSRTSGKVCGK